MNPSPALSVTIAEVLVGRAEPFGPSSFSSAIRKRPVTESINLASVGFAGDEQADRRYHGGPDKAVHHYPFEHYAMWCRERPVLALQLRVGAFGENLSTRGMSEENVCVGDIFRAGSALLQVSQARQPCWKLNVRFGLNDMARLVQASGRTGWYYRVLEEGRVDHPQELPLPARALLWDEPQLLGQVHAQVGPHRGDLRRPAEMGDQGVAVLCPRGPRYRPPAPRPCTARRHRPFWAGAPEFTEYLLTRNAIRFIIRGTSRPGSPIEFCTDVSLGTSPPPRKSENGQLL